MPDNPYLDQVHAVLPRLLALYNDDALSPSYGQGDRFRWAWKLIDFGNGTPQGAAHGLARLVRYRLLPEGVDERSVLRRIVAIIRGADSLRRPNGSMEEAFPFESSFCVTALVAYDLLSAVEILEDRLTDSEREFAFATVRPMIVFLHRARETHALISNHLATAVAALVKWTVLTGEPGAEHGRTILDSILAHQSPEGWYQEYEGADPGYQTLATHYLADIHRLRPDWNLGDSLAASLRFLWHFAHPDGSFGGLYGSRNTRFYYPGGVLQLAAEVPEAAALAEFMAGSIARHDTVVLDVMDSPNLVPMFNTYCWAAALQADRERTREAVLPTLPALSTTPMRKVFEAAGVLVDAGPEHYSVVSFHKGGIVYHYRHALDGTIQARIDAGVVVRDSSGQLYSTQTVHKNTVVLDGDTLTVESPFFQVLNTLPSPFQFLALRFLTLTVMRVERISEWVKRRIVAMLITGKRGIGASNRRVIRLGPELAITDDLLIEPGLRLERVHPGSGFNAIHMASAGYWQRQDDQDGV